MCNEKDTKTSIKEKSRDFFKKLKFINDRSHMSYNSAFAEHVVYPELGLGSSTDQEKKDWWFRYGETVKKAVENRRNGVVNQMKATLMSA